MLILNVNQSLTKASVGMKELNGFSFGIEAPARLQSNGFESVLHPISRLKGYSIISEKDLHCVDEGHPLNFCKQLLTDEIINFSIFLT